MDKYPFYDAIKQRGPGKDWPCATALLRFWEHMENEHGATPEDYGMSVLKWHEANHSDCRTLPTFEEAKKVD